MIEVKIDDLQPGFYYYAIYKYGVKRCIMQDLKK